MYQSTQPNEQGSMGQQSSSLPPNVVSDSLAKDPQQLLLAHLYNYMKENGMNESAMALLSETNVPNNSEESISLPDAEMLIGSSKTFLLEWWCLMWTMQSTMNPNLNQMFTSKNEFVQPSKPQYFQQTPVQKQQQQVLQQRLLLQQQQYMSNQQFMNQQNLQNLQNLQTQISPKNDSMPPPKGNSQQYQSQLRLQQIKMQYQRDQPQLQSPMASKKEKGNEYQLNLLRMENQNNLQKKQFLMKQQQIAQGQGVPPQPQGPQGMAQGHPGMQGPQGPVMTQGPQGIAQGMPQGLQGVPQGPHGINQGLPQGFPQGFNQQIQQQHIHHSPSSPNLDDHLLYDEDDLLKTDIISASDSSNLMVQQQNQLNLLYQLQQKRLQFIQQQQAQMTSFNNGVPDLNMNDPGLLGDGQMFMNPTMMNTKLEVDDKDGMNFMETDWLSLMGSGPGF